LAEEEQETAESDHEDERYCYADCHLPEEERPLLVELVVLLDEVLLAEGREGVDVASSERGTACKRN